MKKRERFYLKIIEREAPQHYGLQSEELRAAMQVLGYKSSSLGAFYDYINATCEEVWRKIAEQMTRDMFGFSK